MQANSTCNIIKLKRYSAAQFDFIFQAHKGMLLCAMNLKKHLEDNNVLEKAFSHYPNYNLVITGK